MAQDVKDDIFIDYEKLVLTLRARCPVFKTVRIASAQALAITNTTAKQTPAAYVTMTGLSFAENDNAIGLIQWGTEHFSVFVELDAEGDRTGREGQLQLPVVRAQLFKALLGYNASPAGSTLPIEFEELELVENTAARQLWSFDFMQPTIITQKRDGWMDTGEDFDEVDIYLQGNPVDQQFDPDDTTQLIAQVPLSDDTP